VHPSATGRLELLLVPPPLRMKDLTSIAVLIFSSPKMVGSKAFATIILPWSCPRVTSYRMFAQLYRHTFKYVLLNSRFLYIIDLFYSISLLCIALFSLTNSTANAAIGSLLILSLVAYSYCHCLPIAGIPLDFTA
jgi:hypothetical protein